MRALDMFSFVVAFEVTINEDNKNFSKIVKLRVLVIKMNEFVYYSHLLTGHFFLLSL